MPVTEWTTDPTDKRSRGERLLTVMLAVALVVALAGVVYVSVTPGATSDPYTELYVLGDNATATNYPTSLEVGETDTVLVGIANEENRDVTYTVVLRFAGAEIDQLTVALEDGERWEEEAAVTPPSAGRHRFQIDLYRGESVQPDRDPYRQAGLWIQASD